MKRNTIIIKESPETFEKLKKFAKENNTTISAIIRKALTKEKREVSTNEILSLANKHLKTKNKNLTKKLIITMNNAEIEKLESLIGNLLISWSFSKTYNKGLRFNLSVFRNALIRSLIWNHLKNSI